MAPLRPSPQLAARVGEAPCATEIPATPLTAIDAVDLALCNNPQTREVWAAARVQAAQVGVAQAAWLPGLDARLSTGRTVSEGRGTNQSSAALTLSWLVFDFGQRSANIENARQLLNAAASTQNATVQSLFLAALQTYYTAQATRAAVISTGEAERAARESFAAADARYNVGVGTPADRLQAQTALSQATLNRIRAEGDARNALGALANAMGFDAQQRMALAEIPAVMPDAAFQRDVDALIADARARRPDLQAAEAQVKAAEASVDLARAQGRPTLSLATDPTWQDVGGVVSNGGNVGLTLNVPLFTGFDTTYRVRSAAAQAEVRAAQRDRLRSQVALDVWRAYQSLTTATQSLKTTADLVASAEQSERVALGRYRAGVGTVLELLTAQSALASARLQRIQAELDWNVFRATLAQTMGALDYTLLQPAAEGRP
ncbi:TolC family protein [Dechloromonas sp. A34]|uniref:TolC family protein n=1 Tax=Dechloromonas sp. A34 TaxID=447588 RepID=UPI002248BBC7|nr:TolC family protein [Dechloromonas sp. A34]